MFRWVVRIFRTCKDVSYVRVKEDEEIDDELI